MADINKRNEERRLPVGITEFETLISDMMTEYAGELPTMDVESLKFVISTSIMHMGPTECTSSMDFFFKTLVAGAAKQIAHHIFQETKRKQMQKDADERAAAEAKEVVNEAET